MNCIEYLSHIIYQPDTLHRRFDFDLPNESSESDSKSQLGRIALVALPFISLYRPAGTAISIGMGGIRVITQLNGCTSAEDWNSLSVQLLQTAFAVFSVATAVFNFRVGSALITLGDFGQSLAKVYYFLGENKKDKALEELLQAFASAAYLGFMATGALEAMLLFSLLQMTISFLQAKEEFAKDRRLEAVAKIAMGSIRLYQAGGYVQKIQQRNELVLKQKYARLLKASQKGKSVGHLVKNPLASLAKEKAQTNLGAYVHGCGKGLVKGMNLGLRTKLVDGKEMIELDFKINHAFREKIQTAIDDLTELDPQKVNELLEITQSNGKEIQIHQNGELPLGNGSKGAAIKIDIEGLGSIFIGADSNLPTMFNRVVVQIGVDKNICELHELVSFLDMDQALHISSKEDVERLKIGHLFRIFSPRQATPFERTNEFFELSIDQLKKKINELSPEMEGVFELYLNQMIPKENLPGKMRYTIPGLGEKAYKHGARGLTAAILVASDQALYERIGSMLKLGMLSSEVRAQMNMNANGISSNEDFNSGGADSIFTQMITKKNCTDGMSFNELNYNKKARFLISLTALESGTYQYYYDLYGNRHVTSLDWDNTYSNRPGILEFIDQLQRGSPKHYWNSEVYTGNEVMIKDRLDPSFFTGIAVNNSQTRDGIMEYLRAENLVQVDEAGRESIRGIFAEKFIRVTDKAREAFFRYRYFWLRDIQRIFDSPSNLRLLQETLRTLWSLRQ